MSDAAGPIDFGRVEADGTVYVRTAEGERMVGQVPDVDPSEALAFFTRRFDSLETEVSLIEARVASGALSPDEARKSIGAARKNISTANAVGDLDGLLARLDALAPALAQAQEVRKAERARVNDQTRLAKEAMVAEAEKLAEGTDWRGGVNRFRSLLEEWKALPRIDRATDDDLWHRFSSARTTYTRRRKSQFAEQSERRDSAKRVKEQIIEEARELATSTDWGPTAGQFRDLMARWKAAGSAPRDDEDRLWTEFRGLQDQFFNARSASQSEQDTEFRANQEAKEALLDAAERDLLPVQDPKSARQAYRDFLTRFNAYGKVPRDAIRPIDARLHALESAVRQAEEDEWKRTDPEARQRAEDTVSMFEAQIAKLEQQAAAAQAKGDAKKLTKSREAIDTYSVWLHQARQTLADFQRQA